MYNLFRKSVIVAGFSLLFLFSCQTFNNDSTNKYNYISNSYVTIENMFSNESEAVVFLDIQSNIHLLNELLDVINLKGESRKIVSESFKLYFNIIDFSDNLFNVVLEGKFSKFKIDLAFTFSPSWKLKSAYGFKFWQNREGLSLYYLKKDVMILTNYDIILLKNSLDNKYIEEQTDSVVLLLPKVDDKLTKKLSSGMISGGVKSIKATANLQDSSYLVNSELELENKSKATSFSRLLRLFLKVLASTSSNNETKLIVENIEIGSTDKYVELNNIVFENSSIVDILNKIIFLEGEADK